MYTCKNGTLSIELYSASKKVREYIFEDEKEAANFAAFYKVASYAPYMAGIKYVVTIYA